MVEWGMPGTIAAGRRRADGPRVPISAYPGRGRTRPWGSIRRGRVRGPGPRPPPASARRACRRCGRGGRTTVFWLMNSRAAISRFVSPSASSAQHLDLARGQARPRARSTRHVGDPQPRAPGERLRRRRSGRAPQPRGDTMRVRERRERGGGGRAVASSVASACVQPRVRRRIGLAQRVERLPPPRATASARGQPGRRGRARRGRARGARPASRQRVCPALESQQPREVGEARRSRSLALGQLGLARSPSEYSGGV